MLNVQQVRLRFISARLLASAYTDVHQLKMVQMVSQPHYSAILIYILAAVIALRLK